jgi:DNA-binding winged helix-turn-helix (wHTH) protein
MDTGSHTPASVSFGRFQIAPHRREFLADGRPVQIGGRAFDVLMALIDAQGSVVSKNALMERVWPDRIVEENNLQIQISALRARFRCGPRSHQDGRRPRLSIHRRDRHCVSGSG